MHLRIPISSHFSMSSTNARHFCWPLCNVWNDGLQNSAQAFKCSSIKINVNFQDFLNRSNPMPLALAIETFWDSIGKNVLPLEFQLPRNRACDRAKNENQYGDKNLRWYATWSPAHSSHVWTKEIHSGPFAVNSSTFTSYLHIDWHDGDTPRAAQHSVMLLFTPGFLVGSVVGTIKDINLCCCLYQCELRLFQLCGQFLLIVSRWFSGLR